MLRWRLGWLATIEAVVSIDELAPAMFIPIADFSNDAVE